MYNYIQHATDDNYSRCRRRSCGNLFLDVVLVVSNQNRMAGFYYTCWKTRLIENVFTLTPSSNPNYNQTLTLTLTLTLPNPNPNSP